MTDNSNTIVTKRLRKKTKKPLVVYFRKDWETRLPVDAIPKVLDVPELDLKFISGWDELAPAIKLEPAHIIFHADVVTDSGHTVDQVISMVKTTAKLILPKKEISLSIGIDTTTTQDQVKEFQKAKVIGIVPSISTFGFDESKAAVIKLLNGELYWPDHIINKLPVAVKKPLVLHFREDFEKYANNIETHKLIQRGADCRRVRVKSWSEFVTAVQNEQPEFITIHYNVIDLELYTLPEFINSVRAMMQYLPADKQKIVPIAIGIDRTCTQNFISQLKDLNIAGIHPAGSAFNIIETITAIQNLLDNKSYWPDHIIDQLPVDAVSTLPRVVSFRAKQQEQWTPSIQRNIKENGHYTIDFCTHWDAFSESITKPTDLILFHCKLLAVNKLSAAEVVNMISSITHYTTGKIAKIAVVVDKDTTARLIKELRKTDICGLVPSSEQWGTIVGNGAVLSILTNKSHWPLHYLFDDQSQIDEIMAISPPVKLDAIALTPRQQEISDLIKNRGISNKHIARQLDISESTVKLHIGSILKKYHLRSRTQLAVALANTKAQID